MCERVCARTYNLTCIRDLADAPKDTIPEQQGPNDGCNHRTKGQPEIIHSRRRRAFTRTPRCARAGGEVAVAYGSADHHVVGTAPHAAAVITAQLVFAFVAALCQASWNRRRPVSESVSGPERPVNRTGSSQDESVSLNVLSTAQGHLRELVPSIYNCPL